MSDMTPPASSVVSGKSAGRPLMVVNSDSKLVPTRHPPVARGI